MTPTYPFCVVMSRQNDLTLPFATKPGYVAAFDTVEQAAAFMFQRGDTNWKMNLISRPTLPMTIENLRLLGVKGFCFNPSKESDGTLVEFDRLIPTEQP